MNKQRWKGGHHNCRLLMHLMMRNPTLISCMAADCCKIKHFAQTHHFFFWNQHEVYINRLLPANRRRLNSVQSSVLCTKLHARTLAELEGHGQPDNLLPCYMFWNILKLNTGKNGLAWNTLCEILYMLEQSTTTLIQSFLATRLLPFAKHLQPLEHFLPLILEPFPGCLLASLFNLKEWAIHIYLVHIWRWRLLHNFWRLLAFINVL